MNNYEYECLQSQLRDKLVKSPYAGWQSDKYRTGYEEGVKACMSTISAHHRGQGSHCENITTIDIDQLEDIAFNGGQMPDLRSQAQIVLFQAFRSLYDYAKRVQMSPDQGRSEKHSIIKAYKINRFLEEVEEATNKMWMRIEAASAEYSKSRTLENADKLLAAINGESYGKE